MSKFGLESIARACARHPWRTLAAWAVVLACAATITVLLLGGALSNEQSFTNDPESFRATNLINETFPGNNQSRELVIVRSASLTVDDQQFREHVQAVTARVMALCPTVVSAGMDYTTDASPVLVSTDRHAALLVFNITRSAGEAMDDSRALTAAAREASASSDFEVLVTGEASINSDFGATAESDLRTGEIFGVGIALIILVLVFGALVTAVVPLIMAMASILLAMGITALVGQVLDLSFFITNMITMIGLAMGIDYSLFVVSRYREDTSRKASRPSSPSSRPMPLLRMPPNGAASLSVSGSLIQKVPALISCMACIAQLEVPGEDVGAEAVLARRRAARSPRRRPSPPRSTATGPNTSSQCDSTLSACTSVSMVGS